MSIALYLSITLIVLYLVLASTILRKHLGSAHHRRFSFFLISVVLWLTAFYGLHIVTDANGTAFWAGWLVQLSLLSSALLLHFAIRGSGSRNATAPIPAFLLGVAYIGTALFIPLTASGAIISVPVGTVGTPTLAPGTWAPIWIVFNSLILLFTAVQLLRIRPNSGTIIPNTNTALVLFSGIMAVLSAGVLDILFLSDQSPFILGLTSYLMLFGFIMIALLKYGFLEIKVNLRETTGYFVSSLVVAFPFLLIFFLLTGLTAEGQFRSRLYFGILFVVAVAVANAWQPLQMMTDRWLNRERYDSFKALELLNLKTAGTSRPGELFKAMKDAVIEVTGTGDAEIRIMVRRDDPATELYRHQLDVDSLFEVDVSEGKKIEETPDFAANLARPGKQLIVPARKEVGRIEGFLFLSPKLTGEEFGERDRQVIQTLAREIASKLENFRLGMELTHQAAIAEAAREAERFKAELLADVSHELRTPLSSIKGFASSLLATDVDWSPAQQRDFIGEIVSESDRLDKLIGDLLDMSRLENGQFRLHKEPIDLSGLMTQLRPRLERFVGRHQLEIDVLADSPMVIADRLRLEQVITNLIDNAAKYSPPSGCIKLTVETRTGEIVFSVSDEGPGIPTADMSKVFERFYRGGSDKTAGTGLGLGLAISRGIVSAHGGKIWIENSPGTGATFHFTLPLNPNKEEK